MEVKAKLEAAYPLLKNAAKANYFVEIQDDLLTNTKFTDQSDTALTEFNQAMLSVNKDAP